MKDRKWLNRALIASSIGVWGTIAYQVVGGLRTDKSLNDEPQSQFVTRTVKSSPFEFPGTIRDPFRYLPPRSKRPDTLNVPRKAEPLWTPPPLKLIGIISTGAKRVALLEAANGTVEFVSPGDSVSAVLIRTIGDHHVAYSYMGKSLEWRLTQNTALSQQLMTK